MIWPVEPNLGFCPQICGFQCLSVFLSGDLVFSEINSVTRWFKIGYDQNLFLVSSFLILFYQGTLVFSITDEQATDTVEAVNISQAQ